MKNKIFTIISVIFVLVITINPYSNVDLGLILLFLFIAGHIFLQEKLILAFLILRPTLDYWNYVEIFRYKNFIFNLNAGLSLLLFFWLLFMLVKNYKAIQKNTAYILFSILILLAGLSSFYSNSFFYTVSETLKLANLGLLFVLIYIFIKKEKITSAQLLKTIVISAIIPLVLGFYQIIFSKGISTFGIHGRIYGSFGHPNVFAFFTLFLLFLHTQFSTISPTEFWIKHKKTKITVYLLLISLILMTYTRAALVGLFVFLLVIGIFRYRKVLLTFLISLLAIIALFYPINYWLKTNTNYNLQKISVINRLTTRNEDADSISWRLNLIRESIPIITSKPILGYGYGTFPIIWEENRPNWHQWDDSAEAHNDYLRLTVELGLIGLILHLLLLLTLFWQRILLVLNKDTQKQDLYLLGWLSAFIVLCLSDNMLHHTALMWVMWAWWGANMQNTKFIE